MQLQETSPEVSFTLADPRLVIEWRQKAHPAVETWWLYVGTKVPTKHPDGGYQWEIRNQSTGKDTQHSIPFAHLPMGREIHIQVAGTTADGDFIYSPIVCTSLPKGADKDVHARVDKLRAELHGVEAETHQKR